MAWIKNQLYINWMARFKNYGFVISLVSAILLALTQFGVQIDNEYVMNCVQAVLAILVLLGIVNNPMTASKGFRDDITTDKQP